MAHTLPQRAGRTFVSIGFAAAILTLPLGAVKAEQTTTPDTRPFALITIPDPHEASLLQLRGISGSGTALFRIDGQCHSMPVRFVAGDFEGRRITAGHSGAIRLRLLRPALVQALYEGQDLVSDNLKTVTSGQDGAADIAIEAGLSPATGFVINPGSSVLSDIWGVRPTPVPCPRL